MPFRYGFELEYPSRTRKLPDPPPLGFTRAYWDSTYRDCGEICSEVFDTLQDTVLAFHSGVTHLLDNNFIDHLLTRTTEEDHSPTGLHISINDPTLDAFHVWSEHTECSTDSYECDEDYTEAGPLVKLTTGSERRLIFNRVEPFEDCFQLKPPRYESKHCCSTVNPYALIKYVHWTVWNYMLELKRCDDHPDVFRDMILRTANDPRAMVENILMCSGTSENTDEILRVCDDLATRVLKQSPNTLARVGLTSLDACRAIKHKQETILHAQVRF